MRQQLFQAFGPEAPHAQEIARAAKSAELLPQSENRFGALLPYTRQAT
jgi:hypothetical protein